MLHGVLAVLVNFVRKKGYYFQSQQKYQKASDHNGKRRNSHVFVCLFFLHRERYSCIIPLSSIYGNDITNYCKISLQSYWSGLLALRQISESAVLV